MRHLILIGSLALLANPVQAEDNSAASLPPQSNASPLPRTETQLGDTPTPVSPVTTAINFEPPASMPAAARNTDQVRKQAARKIELIGRTIKDTTRSKGFFNLFSSSSAPVDSELLQELDRFITRYIDLPETAEAFHLKAQVHHRMEAYPAAALDWLVLMVAYPDSAYAAEAEKRLDELGGNQLKKQAATLKEMMQRAKSASGERDQRIASFLEALGNTLNEPNFAAPLVAECSAFLSRVQTYNNEDAVEHALARQAMSVDHQIAIYHFDKLLALYPDSTYRPDSLLSIATVQRKGQRAYEQAAQSYNRLIGQYPDSRETMQGYESLAAMYNEDMHDYPNAIKTYDAIVAKYKNGPIVLRALNDSALIYQNRMNQPAKAIDSYLRVADIFKGQDGLDALNKAEKIALYGTHDWKSAMTINDRIVELAPDGDDAAKAMFANADIAESKLNDKAQAKALYERLIARQPRHSLAKDAQRRIEAMDKK